MNGTLSCDNHTIKGEIVYYYISVIHILYMDLVYIRFTELNISKPLDIAL